MLLRRGWRVSVVADAAAAAVAVVAATVAAVAAGAASVDVAVAAVVTPSLLQSGAAAKASRRSPRRKVKSVVLHC